MADQKYFRFTPRESRLLHSSLNEILHGFALPDFEQAIGEEKSAVKKFADQRVFWRPEEEELTLSEPETRIVRNALRETIGGLDPWEFPIRTQYSLDDAKAILRKLDRLLGE